MCQPTTCAVDANNNTHKKKVEQVISSRLSTHTTGASAILSPLRCLFSIAQQQYCCSSTYLLTVERPGPFRVLVCRVRPVVHAPQGVYQLLRRTAPASRANFRGSIASGKWGFLTQGACDDFDCYDPTLRQGEISSFRSTQLSC